LDVYRHLWPDEEERTRQAVDDELSHRDHAALVTNW
jgi:hypothetical protein